MSEKIQEMKIKMANLVKESRDVMGVIEKAEKENRGCQEEYNKLDTIDKDIESLEKKIELEERQSKREEYLNKPENRPHGLDIPETKEERKSEQEQAEKREIFQKFLLEGRNALSAKEIRGLQNDLDTKGGYLHAPQQFIMDLLKDVDNATVIRGLATVYQLGKSESLGVPKLDSDVDDANWTSELKTGSEDDAMTFGKRELRPHPLAKRIKISNKLIQVSLMDIEQLVRQRLAYKFGVTQEKAFMTGDGVQKPLGLFVASNDGIGTGRDVSTGNKATEITADGLIEAKHALKQAYWPSSKWLFHRDAIKMIRKMKDGEGNYIWQQGIIGNIPSTILESPYVLSEYVPNTFTSGKYVGLIGDLKYYWVVEALDLQIQVLDQLYAETNQTGYIGRMDLDAAPVLQEAFARVTLA